MADIGRLKGRDQWQSQPGVMIWSYQPVVVEDGDAHHQRWHDVVEELEQDEAIFDETIEPFPDPSAPGLNDLPADTSSSIFCLGKILHRFFHC